MTRARRILDGTPVLDDWAGRTIYPGDTVVYAPGERSLRYARVKSISIDPGFRESWKYDTPGGVWVSGAKYVRISEPVDVVRVRVEPVDVEEYGYGGFTTINSELHPYAYGSLTAFHVDGQEGDD